MSTFTPPFPPSWARFGNPPIEDPHHLWCERLEDPEAAAPTSESSFPLAVKANIAVRGARLSAGSPAFNDEEDTAVADAPVVSALRAGGARVVGTTNMHELAFGITSGNATFGFAENPVAPGSSAGGSSGGSAAAVAAGLVPISLGTDTGGSMSIPAASCGVCAFRPTTGRWPTQGATGLSWSRDTPGVFAGSVGQLQFVDELIAGTATPTQARDLNSVPPVLGVPTEWREDLDAHTDEVFSRWLDTVRPTVQLTDVVLTPLLENILGHDMVLVLWEARRLLTEQTMLTRSLARDAAWQHVLATVASPDVRQVMAVMDESPPSVEEYHQALERVWSARQQYDRLLADAGVDALVFPTTPRPATPLTDHETTLHLGQSVPVFPLMTRHMVLGSTVGAPMVTVPLEVSAGQLPVGLTVQAARGADRQAIKLAGHLSGSSRLNRFIPDPDRL